MQKFKIKNRVKRKYTKKSEQQIQQPFSHTITISSLPLLITLIVLFASFFLISLPYAELGELATQMSQMIHLPAISLPTITLPVITLPAITIPEITFDIAPLQKFFLDQGLLIANLFQTINDTIVSSLQAFGNFLEKIEITLANFIAKQIILLSQLVTDSIQMIATGIPNMLLMIGEAIKTIVLTIEKTILEIVAINIHVTVHGYLFLEKVIVTGILAIINAMISTVIFIGDTVKSFILLTTSFLHYCFDCLIIVINEIARALNHFFTEVKRLISIPFQIMKVYIDAITPYVLYFGELIKKSADQLNKGGENLSQMAQLVNRK